jgi:hypothetical protein
MNYATFARLARKNTKTNSTTFTDQELVDFVNFHIEANTPEIVKADEQAFQMVSRRNLEEGVRQYELPTDVAKRINRVEVYHVEKWWIGKEVDVNSFFAPITGGTDDPVVYDGVHIPYSLFRNCINLYTQQDIEDETNGLALYYTVYPYMWQTTDLVSTVDISIDPSAVSCGFPKEFHEPILHMVTRSYKQAKQVPVPLSIEEQNAEVLFQKSLKAYKGTNRDREISASYPIDYGIY